MLSNDREIAICSKFSQKDDNGRVKCFKCPLRKSEEELKCKANSHYDRASKTWVYD